MDLWSTITTTVTSFNPQQSHFSSRLRTVKNDCRGELQTTTEIEVKEVRPASSSKVSRRIYSCNPVRRPNTHHSFTKIQCALIQVQLYLSRWIDSGLRDLAQVNYTHEWDWPHGPWSTGKSQTLVKFIGIPTYAGNPIPLSTSNWMVSSWPWNQRNTFKILAIIFNVSWVL